MYRSTFDSDSPKQALLSGEVAAENGRATGVMAGKAMDSFDSIYPTHSAKAGD